MRVLNSTEFNAYTGALFKSLGIFQIDQLYTYSTVLFMLKLYNMKLPPVVDDVFVRNVQVHEYFTRQQSSFHVPLARLVRCNRTLQYKSVYI